MKRFLAAPMWLAVSVLTVLAACDTANRAPELSATARRNLTSAVKGDDSGDTPMLDTLRDAARHAPDDAGAQQRYGLAAEQAGAYAEALAALDRAVALDGSKPDRLLAEGRIALEAGNVPGAIRAYTRTLERDPGNIDALVGLGVAADLTRDHAQARVRYQEALRLAPGDWRVRSNLAMSLLMSGSAGDAATVLAGADHDPSAPRRARHDLALALVASGDRSQAIGVLTADMPLPEANALADEFAGFAQWLASPEGARPALQ